MRWLLLLLPALAWAEPPPFQRELSAWAATAGFTLSAFSNCKTEEERSFGSLGSVCWSAKAKSPQKGTKDLYPRVRLVLSVFPDEAAAAKRLERFRELPPGAKGELEKAWPLRAAFRVKERVLTVTTDAVAFERHAYAAAQSLAKTLEGEGLQCWQGCPP